MDSLNENEQVMGRTTPRLLPPKKDSSGIPYRPNRFGFRQTNIVRPASVGLTPKITTEYDSSNNNSQGMWNFFIFNFHFKLINSVCFR